MLNAVVSLEEGRQTLVTIHGQREFEPDHIQLHKRWSARCDSIYRPVAVIFVTDPDKKAKPLVAQIKKQFGLTGAEAAFSVEILKGDGIQAAADRLRILSHIFEKTKTHRQSELVTGIAPRLQQVSNSCGIRLLVCRWAFPKAGTPFRSCFRSAVSCQYPRDRSN